MQKRVFITGAGRGLGFYTTKHLLESGLDVTATFRQRGKEELLALKERYGDRLKLVQLDLFDSLQVEAVASRWQGEAALDVLIHNAGVYPGGERPEYDLRRIMAVNFWGPLQLTRALLPVMAKGGRVISLSSGLGSLSRFSPQAASKLLHSGLGIDQIESMAKEYVQKGALPGWPDDAYGVSKALLNALTRVWSVKCKDQIFVSIDPGWVRTGMGGPGAPNSIEQGIETTLWAVSREHLESGVLYHHKSKSDW